MKRDHEKLKISKESVLKFFPEKEIDVPPILDYESPIKVIMGNMRMEQEDNIFRAVREYGVDVDKDELIKALKYDREQYEKGYINGYNAKASDVAREFRQRMNEKMGKHTHLLGKEYVQRIMREIEKEFSEVENG